MAALAQQGASLQWGRIDDTCPAFLRGASEVVARGEGDSEVLSIGGVSFDRRGSVERNARVFQFEAPPFAKSGWTFRLTTERCIAIGSTAEARNLSSESAAAFLEQSAGLRRADALLARSRSAQDPEQALLAARPACAARRAALGPAHPLVADCQLQLGTLAYRQGLHEEGLQAARAAHGAFSTFRPGTSSLEALAARNLESQTLHHLSRPAESHAAAEEAYEGRKRLLGPSDRDTLVSQAMVGITLRRLGRLEEAIPIYEEVARRQEGAQGATAIDTLRAKSNLSAALQEKGDWDRVVALQREVYEARRATLGETHPTTLVTTHDYAEALWDAGRAQEALALAERSLPLFPASLGEEHIQTLRIKTLLGVVYLGLGRGDEAVPLFREVYAARRRFLGDTHQQTAFAARNLADALRSLDRAEESLATLDGALSRLPTGAQRDVATERELHVVRAYALLRLGQPQKALDSFEGVLAAGALTAEQVRQATPERLATTTGWAQARFELGQQDVAIDTMSQVYRGSADRFGPGHTLTLESMATLASMQAAAGQTEPALLLLADFVERSERRLQGGITSNALSRGRLVQSVRERPHMAGYRTYVRLLAQRDPLKALEVAELTKARSLTEALARPGADDARTQAARIRFARAEESVAAAEIGSTPYLKAVAERSQAEEELQTAMGPATRRAAPRDIRESLRRALAPGTVLVHYVASGDRVLAITSNHTAQVRAKDLGTIAGLADTIEAFRRVLTSPAPATERLWSLPDGSVRWSLSRPVGSTRVSDVERAGQELSRRLLAPLAAELGPARSWIISPDGPLAFLPFEALKLGRQAVMETKSVRYAPSLAAIATMPAMVSVGPRLEFLGVGISRFAEGSGWRELPNAQAEVAAIGQLFAPGKRTILEGAAASEAALRALEASGELRRYRFVHLATHAFLSGKGTALSGVVLSGAGGSGGNDGIVTAAEWPSYRLRSDLVVLSACDTGLGQHLAGEGIVGLPHALLSAGSRAVVLTLWSVPDASAAEFMPKFYKRMLSGKGPAEALRETKLEFARSRGPWSAPRHWAPYVLYGAT